MVGDGPDERTRRRLPSWMVGSRKSSGSNNGDDSETANKASSSVVAEPETKRKRARISSSTQQVSETVKEKKRAPRKKKVEVKSDMVESNDDGEGELSVEDLVTIAKETHLELQSSEFVESTPILSRQKWNKRAKSYVHERIGLLRRFSLLYLDYTVLPDYRYVEADEDLGSEKQPLTATASENESRSSYKTPESVLKSPSHQTTEVSNSTMNLTSEQSLLSPSGTGDPAKDMLDLFLGPLLKKPVQEEKKTEFITIGESFSHQFRQKSQNDLGEEMALRKKTKSSLKDKVSMFLD